MCYEGKSHSYLPRKPKKPFKYLQEKLSMFGKIQNRLILEKKPKNIKPYAMQVLSVYQRCVQNNYNSIKELNYLFSKLQGFRISVKSALQIVSN